MLPEILQLLRRIENWRRCYRTVNKITAVPWYTPPILGDVYQDDVIKSAPVDIADAAILECAWRLMEEKNEKFFIKSEYILRLDANAIRRRLRKNGTPIRNHHDYVAFNYSSLKCFMNSVNKISNGKTI